jgi:hypothetical protein
VAAVKTKKESATIRLKSREKLLYGGRNQYQAVSPERTAVKTPARVPKTKAMMMMQGRKVTKGEPSGSVSSIAYRKNAAADVATKAMIRSAKKPTRHKGKRSVQRLKDDDASGTIC